MSKTVNVSYKFEMLMTEHQTFNITVGPQHLEKVISITMLHIIWTIFHEKYLITISY